MFARDLAAPVLTRRDMLVASVAGVLSLLGGSDAECNLPMRDGVPAVDYHVHIGDGISVDEAVKVARRKGIEFGLLQHAGLPGHGYAVHNDETLRAWVQSLEGQPVFKAIEAEDRNWRSAFSREALATLDYVQADALGLRDAAGRSIPQDGYDAGDSQTFMDRYVDLHVERMTTEPLDILVAPTALPASLRADYDRLWTPPRMRKVIDAAVKHRVALEIETRFRVPSLRFLEMAKPAGVRFAFGSNYQTLAGLGDISYCVAMYKRLELTPRQIFCPAPAGQRAVERR